MTGGLFRRDAGGGLPPASLIAMGLVALLITIGGAVIISRSRAEPPAPRDVSGNGWVAYVRPDGGFRFSPTDVYVAGEGHEPRLLIGSEGDQARQTCPAFSPEGTRLAFAESTGLFEQQSWARRSVVIVGVDGAGRSVGPETRIPARSVDADPCPRWSSDGRNIAYIDGEALRTVRLDDSGPPVPGLDASGFDLDAPGFGFHASFAWSPDGAGIAAVRGSELWFVPADGGDLRLIYTSPARALYGPAWSPDGTRIAIAADSSVQPPPNREGVLTMVEPELAVLVLRADGNGEPMALGAGAGLVWSPAGDRVAFLAGATSDPPEGTGEIVVADPDGGNRYVVPPVPIAGGEGTWRMHAPVWSPDGSRLVAIGSDSFADLPWGQSVLVFVSATGDSEPRVLTEAWLQEYYSTISWQPIRQPGQHAQPVDAAKVPEPGVPLEPGRYQMLGPFGSAGWPGEVTVDVPGGWTQRSPSRGSGLYRDIVAKLEFGGVGDFAADACDAPPLGPSVEDFVAALSSVEGMEATEPAEVTLAGFHGRRIEVTHLAGFRGCEGSRTLWWTPGDERHEFWDVISIEGWQHWLWILDVEGLRFVVHASFAPDTPPDLQAQLLRMVSSIDIDP